MDGRHGDALVSDGGVELAELLLEAGFLFVEDVGLVEEQNDGHVVCLCTCEEAVDEGGGRLRMSHSDDEHGLVDVGGNDVALPAEVRRAADDVVASWLDVGDEGRAFCIGQDVHTVAYSNRVGTPDVGESETTLDFRFNGLSVVG